MKLLSPVIGSIYCQALVLESSLNIRLNTSGNKIRIRRRDYAFYTYEQRTTQLSSNKFRLFNQSDNQSDNEESKLPVSKEDDRLSKDSQKDNNNYSEDSSVMLQPPSRTAFKDNKRSNHLRQKTRSKMKLSRKSKEKLIAKITDTEQSAIMPPTSLDGGAVDQSKISSRKFSNLKGSKINKSRKVSSKRAPKFSSFPSPFLIDEERDDETTDEPALTSWDEFFSKTPLLGISSPKSVESAPLSEQNLMDESYRTDSPPIGELPPLSYLFGDDMKSNTENNNIQSGSSSPSSFLEGVLPVSELFYRSTQSISASDERDDANDVNDEDKDTDDEELPFSAEQSNQILTTNNKILVRRNIANKNQFQLSDESIPLKEDAQYITDVAKLGSLASENNTHKDKSIRRGGRDSYKGKNGRKMRNERNANKGQGRKMVRRGMEMLVGGEPINADPPLRSVDLIYCIDTAKALAMLGQDRSSSSQKDIPDWAAVITTNSRDFGPLMNKSAVSKVSKLSREIYCEHFIYSSIKWNVCPKDLKNLCKEYELNEINYTPSNSNNDSIKTYKDLMERISSVEFVDSQPVEMKIETGKELGPKRKHVNTFQSTRESLEQQQSNQKGQESVFLGGELKFTLGVTRTELESGHDGGSNKHILRRVLGKGISNAIRAESLGFDVTIGNLVLNEIDSGSTEFRVEFNLSPNESMKYESLEIAAKKINLSLAQSMDDGGMALAMAAAAKDEQAWPLKVRSRVVDEFLLEAEDIEDDRIEDEDDELSATITSRTLDDEDDFETLRENLPDALTMSSLNSGKGRNDDDVKNELSFDGPFGMPGDTIYSKDDIFLGGGNGGVFPDYSPNGLETSPFSGNLGPLLVDAVIQKSLERQPRVIAIGDVHGCIDELQALLRRCDYRPGDLVVFLGDLVSKGPDSVAVVQMARELGAIGVRGNHDFEVIRWHQAIKSGAEPPVIGSEHYQIASKLSTADMRWMYSLPWYISSKELNALFVHAGFVSGIRLGKQNPRLMMNMRSILPDGTVTSKFFNNWPWARLWDGPYTVLFGHDADRGLQQYEHAIGLDTGCVYGGRLTACILPEKRLVSVSAKREYFQYRRKHFD